MRELSLEYVGGFFDADGSVGIYKRGTNTFQVCVAIANSGYHGRVICDQLKERFGGTVTMSNAKKKTHRDVFWWKTNGKTVTKNFLLSIQDHVIIKKDQVDACIAYIEEWEKMPKFGKTQEQKEYLDRYIPILKEMKRKC